MIIRLEPPYLVGASNKSASRYWFPTDMVVVFNESHFLIDARLADDCGDYFATKLGNAIPLIRVIKFP